MSLSRNTLINLAGAVTPIALTAITVPIYLRTIGGDRYGALVALWLVAGYLGIFDFGMGKSVTKVLSRTDVRTYRQQLIRFGLRLSLLTGALGAACSVPAFSWYFEQGINASPKLRSELQAALVWVVLYIPITTTANMCVGILESRQKFKAIVAANVTGSVVTQLAPLIVAIALTSELQALIPLITLGRALSLAMLLKSVWSAEHPFQTKTDAALGSSARREVYRFGGWITVSNIVAPMLISVDKFILSTSTSLQSVAQYNLAFSMASMIALIPSSLASAIFPKLSSSKDLVEGHTLTNHAMATLAIVITPIVIMGITWSPMVLEAWLGQDFATPAQLPAQILMVGMWPHAFAYIPYARLHALGRPRAVALCHVTQLAPYLVALLVVLPAYGMLGAAVLWAIRATVDSALLFFAARSEMTIPRRLKSDAGWILAALAISQLLENHVALAGIGLLATATYMAPQWKTIKAYVAHG